MTPPLAVAWEGGAAPLLQTLELLAGRLHPLLVHFPIALLLTAAGLELIAALRRLPHRSPTAALCLSLGLVFALATVGSGWLLAANEIRGGGELLELHRWSGVGALLAAAAAWLLGLACRRSPERVVLRFYRSALLVAALLVGLASHVGAELVWGPAWLTAPFRVPAAPAAPPPAIPLDPADEEVFDEREELAPPLAQAPSSVDFWTQVRPILEQSCLDCHGPTQAKGRLRLHERELVLGAGARRAVVVPGDPAASELLRRVSLPAEDDDAMPPDGDRLSAAAQETLRRWIAEGASWPERSPARARAPQAGAPPAPSPPSPPSPLAPVFSAAAPPPSAADQAAALALLRDLGALAQPVARDHAELEVSLARLEAQHLAPALAALPALGPRLQRLELSGTAVEDGDLAGLETWTQLEHLRLDDTALGDATVAALAALPRLRTLNLVGTRAGDAGLARLARAPSLERVHVWRSRVTAEGARALEAARPGLRVIGAPEARLEPDGALEDAPAPPGVENG